MRKSNGVLGCVALRRGALFGLGLTLAVGASAQSLSHAPDQLFHDGFAGVDALPLNKFDAARFLAQATFGPTDADIAHLSQIGYQAWLTEQFNARPTYEMNYLEWIRTQLGEQVGQENRQEAWFLGALGGPDPQYPTNHAYDHNDQLRQRVAFALSEIFVVSDQNAALSDYAEGMAWYYDILARDAFGNYRQLLQDVTLSPAMGVYLNMLGNRRADLSQNVHPDENYGREINQLFSVGLVLLNLDGSPQLDGSGKPIPTYNQSTITNFAHVFTGWNWADCDTNSDGTYSDDFTDCGPNDGPGNYSPNFLTPMIAFDQTNPAYLAGASPSYHDNGTDAVNDAHNKQLLAYNATATTAAAVNGGVLPDGASAFSDGTAAGDLKFALDNIFNHPNVGPFISKQLIQRLVTSNPTPAYVARVAGIFNNDGTGVRGNLKAVVQAILLDPEARYGQWRNPDTFGKLREPLLALTHFWRAMGARHVCGQNVPAPSGGFANMYANQPYRYAGYGTAWSTADTQYGDGVAQAPLDANTVFNFFKPSYLPSGEMTSRDLLGPEFQLQTDSVIANTNNDVYYRAYDLDINDYYDPDNHPGVHCDPTDTTGNVKVNHAQDVALAGSGSGGASDPSDRLVDAYNLRFMSGQMSPFMRDQLVSYLNTIDSSWAYPDGSDWRLQRIKRALYLIFSSPEYMIQK